MSGTNIDPSTPFDLFTMSFDGPPQPPTHSDFSPVSIFDTDDFGTDFTSDSAASPLSPLSPALSATSFGFPATTEAWPAWESAERDASDEHANLFGCDDDDTSASSDAPPKPALSPAINPMDLIVPSSLFQLPQGMLPPDALAIPPQQRLQPQQQQQQHMQTTATPLPPPQIFPPTLSPASLTTTNAITSTRYPSRPLKRKVSAASSSSPSASDDDDDDDNEPAPKSAATTATSSSSTTRTPSTAIKPGRRPSSSSAHTASTSSSRHHHHHHNNHKEPLAPKKTAHNMIEKRYRTNLNDKIAQLRDAVPALRVIAQRAKSGSGSGTTAATADGVVGLNSGLGEFDDCGDEQLVLDCGMLGNVAGGGGGGGVGLRGGGSASVVGGSGNGIGSHGNGGANQAAKLNKATILSKATEYIMQLERRNHGLETENSALRGRMEGLEMLLMRGGGAGVAGSWN